MPSTDPYSRTAGASPHAPPAREEELRGQASRPLLEGYDLQYVIAESSVAVVYAAIDLALRTPVAIKEYLPQRLARRHSASLVVPMPAQAAAYERGLQVFLQEARTLARCDHPSLLRVTRLIEANGTAYRAMPRYEGQRLADVRRRRGVPPEEPLLRAWLDALLGALEAYHRAGRAHGCVTPDNILLLPDARPLLLGPGIVGEALDAGRREPGLTAARDPRLARDAADDVHQLACVACFCITGHGSPQGGRLDDEPLRAALERLQLGGYDPALLDALEAAASPDVARRPGGISAFREWLVLGPPQLRASTAPVAQRDEPHATPEPAPMRVEEPALDPAPHPHLREEAALVTARLDSRGIDDPHADTEPMAGDTQPLVDDTQPLIDEGPSWMRDAHPDAAAAAGFTGGAPVARRHGRMRRWLLPGAVVSLMFVGAAAWVVHEQPVRVEGWTREQISPFVPDLTPRERGPAARPEAMMPAPPAPDVDGNSLRATTPPVPQTPIEAQTPIETKTPIESPDGRASLATVEPPVHEEPHQSAQPPVAADAKTDTSPVKAGAPPAIAPSSTRVATAHATDAHAAAARSASAHPSSATRARTSSNAGLPADACSGRTPFARYRCMEKQCAQARWSGHAQCVRFRRTGEID